MDAADEPQVACVVRGDGWHGTPDRIVRGQAVATQTIACDGVCRRRACFRATFVAFSGHM
jgi:hypothetical protein